MTVQGEVGRERKLMTTNLGAEPTEKHFVEVLSRKRLHVLVRSRLALWLATHARVCARVGALLLALTLTGPADLWGQVCAPVPDGAAGWWPAEGSAEDVIAGHHGVLDGASFGTGRVGQAFSFDGIDDAVRIAHSAGLTANAEVTIEAWLKSSSCSHFNGWCAVVTKWPSGQTRQSEYGLIVNRSTGRISFINGDGGNFFVSYQGPNVLNGVWHHVAVTYGSNVVRYYVDGVQVFSAANAVALTPGSNDVEIGRESGEPGAAPFNGLIDEAAIYNRVLTAAEISAIVTAGNFGKCPPPVDEDGDGVLDPDDNCPDLSNADQTDGDFDGTGDACDNCPGVSNSGQEDTDLDGSGDACDNCPDLSNSDQADTDLDGPGDACDADDDNDGIAECVTAPDGLLSWWPGEVSAVDAIDGNDGVLTNGTSFAPGIVGQAFRFDGVDDHVQIGNPTNLRIFTSGLTVEAWVRAVGLPSQGLGSVITKWNQSASDAYGMWLLEESGTLKLIGAIGVSGDGGFSGGQVALGAWTHVAMTYDIGSGVNELYVNGTRVASRIRFGGPMPSNVQVLIGREDSWLPRPFSGLIDEVAVYDRALTAAEVATIAGAAAGGKCSPFDADADGDGVVDADDNCASVANPAQTDTDLDGAGDACDPDDDGDGVADDDDNCLFTSNPDQADLDLDGLGDPCDADPDGDGVIGGDNCPLLPNPFQEDTDLDGVGDDCDQDDDNDGICDTDEAGSGCAAGPDNCAAIVNAGQEDLDGDGIGNACDADVDGDGVCEGQDPVEGTCAAAEDNCPVVSNPDQNDTEGDGAGDACDGDDDDDGFADVGDNCPYLANSDQTDSDGDGAGDVCDGDRDGDGTANEVDNCASAPNSDQLDFDGDLFGDACDPDIDGDGTPNQADLCPGTQFGELVDAAIGCSIAQLCPCAGPRGTSLPWKNHGKYVSCVAHGAEDFVSRGLISEAEKDAIVSEAAQSDCGQQ